MLYRVLGVSLKNDSHKGANGSGVFVRNMNAIFLGFVGFRFVREATRNSSFSSSSSSSSSAAGSGGAGGGCSDVLLGSRMNWVVVIFWLIVVVVEEGVVFVVGVVVNTMAKGKQRSNAQRRESGFGDSIFKA